jgi:CTP synthase
MATSGNKQKTPKYIFVVGGVMSGVGKGVAASSIGTILQARGLTVTALKIDPYINIDAGTMNPTEHGEVFVLNDGDETDQDMGNYERFLNTSFTSDNYMTTGRVYKTVIEKERNLEYGGRNVEVIPDIPNEVIRRIENATQKANADVTIIEIGGTLGEYQNLIFLEAARVLKYRSPGDVLVVMVSYLPVPGHIGEMKTKPTQYASSTLNNAGLQANIIIARGKVPLDQKRKEKIATFCNIHPDHVISAPDVSSIYDVPLNFEKDNLGDIICSSLNMGNVCRPSDLSAWKKFVTKSKKTTKTVSIAVVGKYFSSGEFVLSDVYLSILEALKFSGYDLGAKVSIDYLSAMSFEKDPKSVSSLKKYDGILIPGGFGKRGVEGKINVIEYARKNKIPYFGICYGMQLMVIEYARHVAKLSGATTREIEPHAKHCVIDIMDDQKSLVAGSQYGGTMRLGKYDLLLHGGTLAHTVYADYFKKKDNLTKKIRDNIITTERHRHRYEVSSEYIKPLQESGLVFSGTSPDGRLMEIAELPASQHPFFVGVQFHPEFSARPLLPHPLFSAFIKASLQTNKK